MKLSIRHQAAGFAWLALLIAAGSMLLSASGARAASKNRGARSGQGHLPGQELFHGGEPPGVYSNGRRLLSSSPRTTGMAPSCGEAMAPAGARGWPDIRPGLRPCATSKRACRGQGASSYHALTAVGRTLYFTADDGFHRSQPWRTTAQRKGQGCHRHPPGGGYAYLGAPTDVGGTLFYVVGDQTHSELWRSDGPATGTTMVEEFGQRVGLIAAGEPSTW